MEPQYFRKGHVIRDVKGSDEDCKTINAAKRRSRELQKRLGDGSLRVVDKLPLFKTKKEET